MRFRVKILFVILFFIGCSKLPVLKINLTPEEMPAVAGRYQAFDLSRSYYQVTTHPDIDAYPAISPDGQWIAFASRRSGNMDIWIKPIRGGGAIRITSHRADDIMPAWSPDGRKLVFVSYRDDAAGDLWMVRIRNIINKISLASKPQRLTRYLGMDVTPAFSPDGKYLAFTSDRDGKPNIYLYQLNRKKVFRITHTMALHPTWAPDGKRIAVVAFPNEPLKKSRLLLIELSFETKQPQVKSLVPITSGQADVALRIPTGTVQSPRMTDPRYGG